MTTREGSLETARAAATQFLSKDGFEQVDREVQMREVRKKHGLLPAEFQTVDKIHEDSVAAYIESHKTWRSDVYLLRDLEYWRLRAEYHPYLRRSDDRDNFFMRGISCHPRLSDYPMCKTVIRDYFVCRDTNPALQVFNTCAPLKEQFCACINEVFVKNHERGDKKFNDSREQYFANQRSKRFTKILNQAEESIEKRSKLQD